MLTVMQIQLCMHRHGKGCTALSFYLFFFFFLKCIQNSRLSNKQRGQKRTYSTLTQWWSTHVPNCSCTDTNLTSHFGEFFFNDTALRQNVYISKTGCLYWPLDQWPTLLCVTYMLPTNHWETKRQIVLIIKLWLLRLQSVFFLNS